MRDLKTPETKKAIKQESDDRDGFEKVIRALKDLQEPLTRNGIVNLTKFGPERVQRLMLLGDGVISVSHTIEKSNGYYKLNEIDESY